MNISWCYDQSKTNWSELSELYKIAPLGIKLPADLQVVFSNSRFKCFVFDGTTLIGVGRALADGLDCSYICGIYLAVCPDGLKVLKKRKEKKPGRTAIKITMNIKTLVAKPGMEKLRDFTLMPYHAARGFGAT